MVCHFLPALAADIRGMRMMRTLNKKLADIFLALLTAIFAASAFSAFPVYAADGLPRLVDDADLLSDDEEAELSDMLDEISERQQVDVVVVTVGSMNGQTAVAYSDDFFDYNGYGFGDERDGVLLLVCMDERDWNISTSGYGITAFTDAGQEYISEIFLPDLSDGNYAAAFTSFAQLCDDFITQANTGEPYDIDNLPKEPFSFLGTFITAFLIAFVIALIATGIMKGQLKSVHSQSAASNYIQQGSMQLTKKNDLFLYSHVERRRKPENTSSNNSNSSGSSGGSTTHVSSSGRTHGGSGGKF